MINNTKQYTLIKWWRMIRPHTLTASFIPVILGSILALENTNTIQWNLFLAMLIASVLIQIATNLFNEYFDFKRGLDTADSVGIGGSIVRDGFQPRTISNLAKLLCFISLLIGLYICVNTNWWVGLAGIICMAIGYLYSGGPRPIAYTPFGEIVSGLFMGLFILWISFYIQTDTLSIRAVLISLPIGFLVGAINMANNIRDLDNDQEKGRRTLPIILGHKRAVQVFSSVIITAYLWLVCLVMLKIVSFWVLVVFFSLPKALQAINKFKIKASAIVLMPAMRATAQLSTLFGLLLFVGLVLERII
ncbi:1,4-dihydroxy-2-naphthoate polyprenyltransferase [Sulfurospirillum arcachonense]|uniref:1,4-dihydroxy-2-naphthoate polyprenyltransferase n=1 Tax=Sulfurospirillum arcachonense TaxID=57666 RepID=UPI0004690E15|nr:1,4-dihydroxy-2-naphthoate polyprenyltransferase [Sulfurospirillum arcachonense]